MFFSKIGNWIKMATLFSFIQHYNEGSRQCKMHERNKMCKDWRERNDNIIMWKIQESLQTTRISK